MNFNEIQKKILQEKFKNIKATLKELSNDLVDRIEIKVPHKHLDIKLILNLEYSLLNVGYMNYYIFNKGGLEGYDRVGYYEIYIIIYNWDNLKMKIDKEIEKQNFVFK